jgi:hypothetical protein
VLFRDIIHFYFENHTKSVNTFCGQNTVLVVVKRLLQFLQVFKILTRVRVVACIVYVLVYNTRICRLFVVSPGPRAKFPDTARSQRTSRDTLCTHNYHPNVSSVSCPSASVSIQVAQIVQLHTLISFHTSGRHVSNSLVHLPAPDFLQTVLLRRPI